MGCWLKRGSLIPRKSSGSIQEEIRRGGVVLAVRSKRESDFSRSNSDEGRSVEGGNIGLGIPAIDRLD